MRVPRRFPSTFLWTASRCLSIEPYHAALRHRVSLFSPFLRSGQTMVGFAEGLKSLLSLTKNMDKTVKVRGVSASPLSHMHATRLLSLHEDLPLCERSTWAGL